uniref:SWIRM domain-containing protein n=1 Tax=Spongospora subterranea TaxID=70186 RepID=A0A0H5R901_9EUKA|eukprot:CRZ10256.1 hypothetical protein [Spongospora subterranea]
MDDGANPRPISQRITPPHILIQLRAIRQTLVDSDIVVSSYSALQLGSFLFRLEDLQANYPVKLPWNLLNDFSVDGGAQIILSTMLRYASEQGWSSLELDQSSFGNLLPVLLEAIAPLRSFPQIYICPSIPAPQFESLTNSIIRLQGTLVDLSRATHIIDMGHQVFGDDSPAFRIVAKTPTFALVHQSKHTRFNRRWVPIKEVPSDTVDDSAITIPSPDDPVRVSPQWITDSLQSNEWLDERDFVLSDEDPSIIRLTKKNGSFAIQSISGPIVKGSPEGVGAAPSKKRRSSLVIADKQQTLKRIRASSPPASAVDGSERHPLDDESISHYPVKKFFQQKPTSIDDEFPYHGSLMVPVVAKDEPKPSFPTIIPCYSTWFSFNSIHANEKKSLHELFSSGENIEPLYMQQRNFIVNAYRANPRVHLSATACRKMIAGDVVSLIRIHNFLEQWGIINYHVDPGSLPQYSGPGNAAFNVPDVYVHSPYSGVKKLSGNNNSIPEPTWDQSELVALLNAVSEFGEDWRSVAEAVGNSKTAEQCVQQFLRIPLEVCSSPSAQSGSFPNIMLAERDADLMLPFKDSAHSLLNGVTLLAALTPPESVLGAAAPQGAEPSTDGMQIDNGDSADITVGMIVRIPHFGTGIVLPPARSDGIVSIKLPFGVVHSPVDEVVPVIDELPLPDTTSPRVLQAISQSCMMSAAIRAKEVSNAEAKNILSLIGELVETQMKKVEIKLKQFDEVQIVLSRQRELIEQARQEVFAERIELAHARMKLAHSVSIPSESAMSPTNT